MKVSLIVAAIVMISSLRGQAQEKHTDCIYDSTVITNEFIKAINVDSYRWDNDKKEAKIITKQGDFLYIKKWACITRGLLVRLIVVGDYQPIESNFLQWKTKTIETAKEVLAPSNYTELKAYLEDESLVAERIGTDLVFNITTTTMKKFVVVISPIDRMVIINYLLYE